jgi:hypothetical protein
VREIVALLARGGPVMIPLAGCSILRWLDQLRPTDFEDHGTGTASPPGPSPVHG